MTANVIVIDEAWWGNYSKRAFNMCKNPQVSLMDLEAEDMSDILKIYVPRT